MIEFRRGFGSYRRWQEWFHDHGPRMQQVQRTIVRNVRAHGLTEPISDLYRESAEIRIDETHLQGSLTCAQLNSRKRAGLVGVETAITALAGPARKQPRILGCEAVTRTAQILRGRFPYYLGTEYLPTQKERDANYPITHLDLMEIAHPDSSFDVFFSAHVLEHVPAVDGAIGQIARILRPGGVLVSTFPFEPNHAKTSTRARIAADGTIEHLAKPVYHGNPVRPEEGSLVFQLPGWDILDMCRAAGLTKACMYLFASSRHGIVSNGSGGVFILFAQKPVAPGSPDNWAHALRPMETETES